MKNNSPSIAWSEFATKQNERGYHSKFLQSPEKLISLIKKHWKHRLPGTGRKDLSEVVVVPIRERKLGIYFSTPWGSIKTAKYLRAKVVTKAGV